MAGYNAYTVEGQTLSVGYSGTVDTITVKKDGLYKLEAYGAAGGTSAISGGGTGGAGGYAVGYVFLPKGTILYACVGGVGTNAYDDRSTSYVYPSGGFNGGGSGSVSGDEGGAGGGGATHIASMSGTLAQIGASNLSKIFIVAGGGGGGYSGVDYGRQGGTGGTGGGESGGRGTFNYWPEEIYSDSGTQTSGYAFGQGQGSPNGWIGAGGGGLYGGLSGRRDVVASNFYHFSGGGGGSGYIGGVPAITFKRNTYYPSMFNGAKNGNGLVQITLVKKSIPTIYFGDMAVDAIYYGDIEVDTIYFGDTEIN